MGRYRRSDGRHNQAHMAGCTQQQTSNLPGIRRTMNAAVRSVQEVCVKESVVILPLFCMWHWRTKKNGVQKVGAIVLHLEKLNRQYVNTHRCSTATQVDCSTHILPKDKGCYCIVILHYTQTNRCRGTMFDDQHLNHASNMHRPANRDRCRHTKPTEQSHTTPSSTFQVNAAPAPYNYV